MHPSLPDAHRWWPDLVAARLDAETLRPAWAWALHIALADCVDHAGGTDCEWCWSKLADRLDPAIQWSLE